jgi:hypothetical protein
MITCHSIIDCAGHLIDKSDDISFRSGKRKRNRCKLYQITHLCSQTNITMRSKILGQYQMEHRQIYPAAGYVEHCPLEILKNTLTCIAKALSVYEESCPGGKLMISSIGLTNQRETTIGTQHSRSSHALSLPHHLNSLEPIYWSAISQRHRVE